MNIKYNGFGSAVITMKDDNDVRIGNPVMITNNNMCRPATNGNDLVGIAVARHGGLISVQVAGYVELPYIGTAPSLGYAKLACAGNNTVKATESGHVFKVLRVNTETQTVGFIL